MRADRRSQPDEYLPLTRGAWFAEHWLAGGNLAFVHALIAAVGATVTYVVLRRAGARAAVVIGPSLLLVGQNFEPWVGLAVALAAGGSVVAAVAAGALKVIPGAGVVPLIVRAPRPTWRALVGIVVFLALPALAAPGAIGAAMDFAAERPDARGTVWGLLDVGSSWPPLVSVVVAVTAVAILGRRHLDVASSVALAVLVAMAFNKVWQPHYVLWLMPALARTGVDVRTVRALEVTSLVYFFVLWSDLETSAATVNGVAVLRLGAAAGVGWSVWRSARGTDLGPDVPQHDHVRG